MGFFFIINAILFYRENYSTNHSTYSDYEDNKVESYSALRLFLLISTTFAYGLEFCYKLCTRQLIYILNPCHIICVIQIILLATPYDTKSRWVAYLFRIHLSQLYLPLIAFVCPVTNTLFFPGEVFTYYFEHVFLLGIPVYLILFGGPAFTVEPFFDLGYRHASYNISLTNLDIFINSLIKTMAQHLGKSWTRDHENAWYNAFDKVAMEMSKGMISANSYPKRASN